MKKEDGYSKAAKYMASRFDKDNISKWIKTNRIYHKYPANKQEEIDNAINGIMCQAYINLIKA